MAVLPLGLAVFFAVESVSERGMCTCPKVFQISYFRIFHISDIIF